MRRADPPRSASIPAERAPSGATLRSLDWLNFFLADVQTGVGPFLAIYLAGHAWNEQEVGVALTAGGIAGIVLQTPAGWIVDVVESKRALIAAAVAALAAGALLIAFWPAFWPVMGAQVLIGGTSTVLIPAVCAISLGCVGHAAFDARQGRNQGFNSAGNVAAAVAMGGLGYLVSSRSIFYFVTGAAVPTLIALSRIRPADIDQRLARGAQPIETASGDRGIWMIFEDRRLCVFLVSSVLFHFANAAMLPLLGELLAKGRGRSSMLFMSACVIVTQLVITLLAAWTARKAGSWGRKPFLLIAFGVLPIRGVLYTLTSNEALLVAIQLLDGIGAGLFGVVSVLVISDLTRGTGRFNLTLGAVTTAVGIGAALSQGIAGALVHHLGYQSGFLFLALVAAAAFALIYLRMPETGASGAGALGPRTAAAPSGTP